MSDPQGLAFWPGVKSLVSASFTFTPGISPNSATLTIPPQRGVIARSGVLAFSYGRERFFFPDAALDTITEATSGTGHTVWELAILDRRWQWRDTGKISGFYNVRRGERIVDGTEKTPQELAKLCLDAMREKGADVRQLPNKARPEVDWDYTNPAAALADLCDQLGCLVVLGLDNRVRIWRQGVGAKLPQYPILDGSLAVDPPEPPDEIKIVAARTRYQADFELEAVGLEADGTIRPIGELSYAPRPGIRVDWRFSDVQYFAGIARPELRQFAQQSVFRWYRIKAPFNLPGVKDAINDVSRILPLEAEQVETWTIGDEEEPRPAWIYGVWTPGTEDHKNSTAKQQKNLQNKPKGLYNRGFDLDTANGIVRFAEPVIRWVRNDQQPPPGRVATGQLVFPPQLWLRVAVNLRDEETGGWIREEFTIKPKEKGKNKQVRYILREDVVREIYDRTTAPARLIDNIQDAKKLADDYLKAEILEYRTKKAGSLSFAGFVKISPDGLTRQVSWSVSQDGTATTRVSQNREELFIAPAYRERRFLEKLQKELAENNKPARQRRDDLKKRGGP